MRRGIDGFPRSRAGSVLLASAALLLAGCSIDSYLTDTNGVQCDGRRTIADFSKETSQVSFFAHEEGADTLDVTVKREGEHRYEFQAEPSTGSSPYRVNIIGNTVHDGSANPDFSFTYGNAVWSVDVRPDDPSAVISGNCS